MVTISYKRDKLIWNAVGCTLLSVAGVYVALLTDWHFQLRILGGLLGICLPFVAAAAALRLRSGAHAIVADQRGVTLATLYRDAEFAWHDIRAIDREVLVRESGFGLIKQEMAHYIVFTVDAGGGALDTVKVQEDLLDLAKGDIPAVVERLTMFWMGAARRPAGLPMEEPAAPVVAAPTLNGMPLAPARGFGRKGL